MNIVEHNIQKICPFLFLLFSSVKTAVTQVATAGSIILMSHARISEFCHRRITELNEAWIREIGLILIVYAGSSRNRASNNLLVVNK